MKENLDWGSINPGSNSGQRDRSLKGINPKTDQPLASARYDSAIWVGSGYAALVWLFFLTSLAIHS